MIYIYSGKTGTGKTWLMTYDIFNRLKRSKEHVWTNMVLDFGEEMKERIHYFREIKELLKVESGIILIDEIQIYINARKWETMPEEFQYKLQQHRKDGLDIYGTTQHISRVDIVFRLLVQKLYTMRCVPCWGVDIFLCTELDTDSIDSPIKKVLNFMGIPRIEFRFPTKRPLYNTLAKIPLPEKGNIVTHEFSKCLACGKEKLIS